MATEELVPETPDWHVEARPCACCHDCAPVVIVPDPLRWDGDDT